MRRMGARLAATAASAVMMLSMTGCHVMTGLLVDRAIDQEQEFSANPPIEVPHITTTTTEFRLSAIPTDATDPTTVTKAEIDTTRGYFLNRQNLPDMEAEGVKGKIKEAYFTKDGDLAVTLNVVNGADAEHSIKEIDITIVNDRNEIIAQQFLTEDDFQITYRVAAYGRREVYFEIAEESVFLPEDSLQALGTTIKISSYAQTE